nr:MAG TPA: tail tape measure [Caudoviricetes sp.]
MADSALGAALTIPKSALDAIEQADKKLKDIQDTAKNTASSVTQSFKDMSVGTKPFLDSLDQVIAKLATINASASNASSGISNVGASAGNMNNNITSAAQNIQNMVAQLSKMNGSGTSGIMQAALAFQRLQESAKGASGMNIAELKQEIGSIESMLRDTTQNLTKADQDALIKRKKSLQDELRYQQQMYNERAVAFQKALDKMVSAEQSYNNKQRKAYADRAKDYQTRNNKANTTYQGALDFSATANTLNRQVRAIEYLKEARMKLSQTDADYKRKLDILNAAIEQHNKNLKEAGVNSRALTEQTSYMAGYMSRWAQRMAFAFSVGSIKNFVEQIASVRGQFELSERSLEAILQNKPKADEIFNKTVELAVKSPFRIKDLVDYTRQLSAYRIESDKLYDTTKRLADVSAGLGVDMGRLILAYGQVKAAAYLRGSEVRQFTEAGINMYGELQQYFKEVKGEAYTTAQIVDMISKRKVTFEDVEAIFQRMTDKGGTFYNMQEIQAETLQGKISNLKDAFDVMLNDIGKANDDTFKGLISGATVLLRHWETIASVGKDLIGILALLMLQSNKAGVSLKEIWNANFTSYSLKGKNALGLITASFRNLGSAAKTAGKMIKWAVMDNLPLIAFAALAQAVSSAYFAYEKFREEQSKIITETIDAKKRLGELSAEYERIKDKFTERADGGVRIIINKDRFLNDSKSVLEDLYDELKKRNLEIPISIEKVDLSNLDKAIKESKKKIDTFIQMAQDAKSYINGEDNSFFNSNNLNLFGIPLWADSFSKDMKELDDAANDVRQFASRAQTAIEALGEGYDKLSVKSRAAYDSIKDGAKPNELDVEYLQRVNKVMGEIFDNERNNSSFEKYANNLRKQLYGLSDNLGATLSGSFRSAKEEAAHEIQGLFDSINNIYGGFLKNLKPAEIKVFWDNVATENNLGELQKKILLTIASKIYHFKVDADSQSMNNARQRVYSFMDDLQAEADRRKIKISLDVIDPKDALGSVQGFQRSAKDIKELIDQINRGKIQWYHGSSLGISHTMKWGSQNVGVNTVFNKKSAISFLRSQLKNVLTKNYLSGGLDPFASKNTNKNSKVDKQQRDILSERISLLKEMNKQYEQLDKYMDDDSAAQSVMKQYADNLKYVGMPDEIVKSFVPDKQGLIQALRQIEPTIKDFKKRAQLKNDIVELQIQLDTEFFQQQLNDVKNEISKSFDQLNLYKKLQGEGLSDGLIKSMFGDLTSSFADVRKGIEDQFTAKFGNNTKWSSDIWKQYQEQMDKLDKEVYQDQVNQAQELIKAYKQQLTDQLQLDRWYINERYKLQNNTNIAKNPELQRQLQENLNAQYKKKTDENTWKNFKNSDMYVRLFDNLDQVSSKALDAMAERLQKLRTELRDLDPTELKTIAEQINKVNEVRNSRNPFKAFTSGLKEMIKASKDLKKSGGVERYVELNGLRADLTSKLQSQNAYVESLEQEYNELTKIKGADESVVAALKLKLATNKGIRDSLKSQLNLTDEQIAKLGTIMTEEEQAKAKFSKSVTDITDVVSTMANSFNALFEALSGSDANLENTLDIVSNIGQAVGSYYSGNYAGVVSGAMGALTGIAKLFSNEGKIDKEIARQERAVNSLQHAYEKLKKSMDDAFDTQKLYEYNQKSVDALKKQQKAYQAMINAERGRKKPDEGKIQEWEQQIGDLNTTIQELGESMTEALGGFGSQSNYKSAAEAFSEAWVDAFNEGSDALEALNNKFDEYFNTMLTKQLMNRATSKYIQPILEAFDKAVSEGSEGGNNGLDVTKKELEGIKELKDKNLALFNEYAKNLMDVLNVKPTGSSNISALQQGIQSVTESTAQALESILNSLRFYVATQQADVRIIRDTLLEKLGNSINAITQDTSSSPVLIELRLQTTILTDIRDTLDSCVKGGHKQGRNGIKVFMN